MINYKEQLLNIYIKQSFAFTKAEQIEETNSINNILKEGIPDNTILLFEPNTCHAECIPSYIKYFIELGFNIHLITSKKNIEENPFVNCHFDKNKLKVFSFKKAPTSPEFFTLLSKYKYVLLLSFFFYCSKNEYYIEYLKKNYINHDYTNLFVINHEVDYYPESNAIETFFADKTFVLRDGIKKDDRNAPFPFISPIYFGEYTNLIKKKSNTVKFLCIGGNYRKNLRNYENLSSAIKQLNQNNITNFEIYFIGAPDKIFKEYAEKELINVHFTGRIDFATLYKYHIESDFIIFNIDKNTCEYERYLHKKISGSYSMSLGFLRPGIIDKQLCLEYKLSNTAITYTESLYDALIEAIMLTDDEFLRLQNNLKNISNQLKEQSLNNLRKYFHA